MPASSALSDVRAKIRVPKFQLQITNYKLQIHRCPLNPGDGLPYCTVSVTLSACVGPPTAVAVTEICDVPIGVGCAMVTDAVPGAPPAAAVAVTVTVAGFGTSAGAEYRPLPLIVPFAFPPVTLQVTLWLFDPFTVAVNCCCVTPAGQELPASSAYKVADAGLTVTDTPDTVSVSVGVVCVSVPSVP